MRSWFMSIGGASVYDPEPKKWTDYFAKSKGFFVTWPLAWLFVNRNAINLWTAPLGRYRIERQHVDRITFQRNFFSWGIRITHTQTAVPELILYYTFFNRFVLKRFERMGYPLEREMEGTNRSKDLTSGSSPREI